MSGAPIPPTADDRLAKLLHEVESLRDREQGYILVQESHLRVIAALKERLAVVERAQCPAAGTHETSQSLFPTS